MSSKGKARESYEPLTQRQCNFLTECFKVGLSARRAAPLIPCSRTTAWKCYQRLRLGEILTEQPSGRHKKPTGPKPGVWKTPRESLKPNVAKKPLMNEARFYRSNFEPA